MEPVKVVRTALVALVHYSEAIERWTERYSIRLDTALKTHYNSLDPPVVHRAETQLRGGTHLQSSGSPVWIRRSRGRPGTFPCYLLRCGYMIYLDSRLLSTLVTVSRFAVSAFRICTESTNFQRSGFDYVARTVTSVDSTDRRSTRLCPEPWFDHRPFDIGENSIPMGMDVRCCQ